jgi:predicted TIM-barrel fold metal-dependent hydrolase
VLIIDSHVHCAENWAEPFEVLTHQLKINDVAYAVLIGHNGNYDNRYLLSCANRSEGRMRAVGLVDGQLADCVSTLRAFHRDGGAGIRINLRKQAEWDPEWELFKVCGELGMVVSVIGHAENFASERFRQLLTNCPDTHFSLEHLCRSPGSDVAVMPFDGYEAALQCAAWANTSIKVPGQGEILKKPQRLPVGYPWGDTVAPHYAMAKAAFGVQRMMWGSNFPPCAAKEGYRNTLNGVRNMPLFQDGDDLEWVMGKTAAKLWGFAG